MKVEILIAILLHYEFIFTYRMQSSQSDDYLARSFAKKIESLGLLIDALHPLEKLSLLKTKNFGACLSRWFPNRVMCWAASFQENVE